MMPHVNVEAVYLLTFGIIKEDISLANSCRDNKRASFRTQNDVCYFWICDEHITDVARQIQRD